MRWAPDQGHVPRGFCGATGALEEVQLVLVVAEPGDPQPVERYAAGPEACLDAAYGYAYEALRTGLDVFHRNLRRVLDLCWPATSFEEQLRRTWITESVLCSALVECGPVASGPERACRTRYLEAQLALLPHAVVVALGAKAQHRLRGLPGVLSASAVAPPGCNHPRARASWAAVAELVRQRTVTVESRTER
jgi:uracil-DNA glycosylase